MVTIDGTEIVSGSTIDGQEISEITMDGDVVWTAIPDSGIYPILRSIDRNTQIEIQSAYVEDRKAEIENDQPPDPKPNDAVENGGTVVYDWVDLDGVRDDLSNDYELANNLTSNTPGYDEVVDPDGDGFYPIGVEPNTGDAFSGEFDGLGLVISDLVLYDGNTSGNGQAAMFGGTDGADIYDLGVGGEIKDPDIGRNTGLLVGSSAGSDDPVHIRRCFTFGSNDSKSIDRHAGGFIGDFRNNNDALIEDCYSLVDPVDGGNTDTGGFGGNVTDGNIRRCYSIGAVSGSGDLGGFIGDGGATVDYCYWDEENSGESTGIDDGSGDVTGLQTDEMRREAAETNMIGFDFDNDWEAVG